MTIRKVEVQTTTTQYSDTCSKCKKKIVGSTESQVRYNMKIHKQAKHIQNMKGGIKQDENSKD